MEEKFFGGIIDKYKGKKDKYKIKQMLYNYIIKLKGRESFEKNTFINSGTSDDFFCYCFSFGRSNA